jgi:hypothetical protein
VGGGDALWTDHTTETARQGHEDISPEAGYLHVSFRRENPTTLQRDFVIANGLRGPGRFLGSAVGIRVLHDDMSWYGEGEFKIYRDGDQEHPTICGTGLEDYVGSARGMGKHTALYAGVPINVVRPAKQNMPANVITDDVPDFVGFYRWHLPDPIVFHDTLRATIQQIGALMVPHGQESSIDALSKKYTLAGTGWERNISNALFVAFALAERRDDYVLPLLSTVVRLNPYPERTPKLRLPTPHFLTTNTCSELDM